MGEEEEEEEEVLPLGEAYGGLWRVVKLPAVQRLALVLVTCKLGTMAAEQVGSADGHAPEFIHKHDHR